MSLTRRTFLGRIGAGLAAVGIGAKVIEVEQVPVVAKPRREEITEPPAPSRNLLLTPDQITRRAMKILHSKLDMVNDFNSLLQYRVSIIPAHSGLVKALSLIMASATEHTDPNRLAERLMSAISMDIKQNPKDWPGKLDKNMSEANQLIAACFED